MAVPTDQQILDAVRTAFHEIVVNGAASYAVNGRSFNALNLKDLEAAISTYEAKVSRASRRMFAPIRFDRMR